MFNALLRRLFPPKTPFTLHEPLKRTKHQEMSYTLWVEEKGYQLIAESIRQAIALGGKISLDDAPVEVVELRHKTSNGLAIYNRSTLANEEFEHFFFWLGSQVRDLGYVQAHADRYIKEHGVIMENKSRIYLKPIPTGNMPMTQRFGNIHLELYSENQVVKSLKIQANVYSDRSYLPAEPFDELLDAIF
jgi:hypothetical protein